jgi:hypothetical protein
VETTPSGCRQCLIELLRRPELRDHCRLSIVAWGGTPEGPSTATARRALHLFLAKPIRERSGRLAERVECPDELGLVGSLEYRGCLY